MNLLKSTTFLATLALAETVIDSTEDSLTFCMVPVSTELSTGTVWDLSDLDVTFSHKIDGKQWTWDYCDTINGKYYAISTNADGSYTAWAGVRPQEVESITDSESGLITGVQFTMDSYVSCETGSRSFKTIVNCAEGEDLARVEGPVVGEDCTATVTFTGDAGCPVVSASDTSVWLTNNMWLLGIIYLIIGPFVAFRGLALFPYVAATVGAFTALTATYLLLFSYGLCDETAGFWISVCLSLAAAVLAGCFIRRATWIAVGLISACGAFFLVYLIQFPFAYFDELPYPVWVVFTLSFVAMIPGFMLGLKCGSQTTLIVTSFIGSYFIMRALTCFFWTDYWPSESDFFSGKVSVEFGYQFFFFLAVLIGTTIVSYKVQSSHEKHSELDEYEKAQS